MQNIGNAMRKLYESHFSCIQHYRLYKHDHNYDKQRQRHTVSESTKRFKFFVSTVGTIGMIMSI